MQGRHAADSAAILGLDAAGLDSELRLEYRGRKTDRVLRSLQATGHSPKGKPVVSMTRRYTSTFYDGLLGETRISLTDQGQPGAPAVRGMARDSRSTVSGKF